MEISSLGQVDLAMLVVLLLSMLVGLVRGVVFEVLSVAGWFVTYFGAQWLAPELAPFLPVGSAGSALNLGAAFVLAFIGVMLVWSLLSRLARLLIRATPLSLPDRALGAAFGGLRGLVLLLVATTVIGLTPAHAATWWRDSRGAPWLEAGLRELRPMLPVAISRHLPA